MKQRKLLLKRKSKYNLIQSQFTVVIITGKGNKVAGVCNFDFGALVNNGTPGKTFHNRKIKEKESSWKDVLINLQELIFE